MAGAVLGGVNDTTTEQVPPCGRMVTFVAGATGVQVPAPVTIANTVLAVNSAGAPAAEMVAGVLPALVR